MSGPPGCLVLSHVCLSGPVGFGAVVQDVLPSGPRMDDQHIPPNSAQTPRPAQLPPPRDCFCDTAGSSTPAPIRFCFIRSLCFCLTPWEQGAGRSCLTVLGSPEQCGHRVTTLYFPIMKNESRRCLPDRNSARVSLLGALRVQISTGQSSGKAVSYLARVEVRVSWTWLMPALPIPSWWPRECYISSLSLSF